MLPKLYMPISLIGFLLVSHLCDHPGNKEEAWIYVFSNSQVLLFQPGPRLSSEHREWQTEAEGCGDWLTP